MRTQVFLVAEIMIVVSSRVEIKIEKIVNYWSSENAAKLYGMYHIGSIEKE